MECILTVKAPADFPRVIRAQREAVEARVRELTNSHTVHNGLAAFRDGPGAPPPRPGGTRAPVPFDDIAGLRAAGWCAAQRAAARVPAPSRARSHAHARPRPRCRSPVPMRFRLVHPGCGSGVPTRDNLHRFMRAVHTMVCEHADGWPFLEPVDPTEVPDYYEIVKEPIDLRMILDRIECGDYYITLEIFAADFRRLFNNCRHYNAPDTPYFKCANRLEAFFEQKARSAARSACGAGARWACERFRGGR
jgi:histone acetyltransferase